MEHLLSPSQLCLCSICRKVGGAGGSINLGGFYESLKVEGKENIRCVPDNQIWNTKTHVLGPEFSEYQAVLNRDTPSEKHASSSRSFCSKCGSMLWLHDPHWPDLVHPFASAIDSPLELDSKTEMVCIMTDSKPPWVRLPEGPKLLCKQYGPDSLEEWHKKHNVWKE